MVDIAASLSLTATGPALDAGGVLGLETADMQAFGDILAGKVGTGEGVAPTAAAPANPFAALALTAGNRQPGGKILPDAAAALPEPAASEAEGSAAAPVPLLMTTQLIAALAGSTEKVTAPESEDTAPEPAKQAEGSPVHGLIKLLTAAFKNQRSAVTDQTEEAPAEGDAPAADPSAETTEPAITSATAIAQLQATLPLPLTASQGQASAPHSKSQAPSTPGSHAAPRAVERAAVQSAVYAAANPAPVAAQPVSPDAAAAAPVLTVAAAATEAPIAAVTLAAQPVLPVARAVTARVKLAAAETSQQQAPVADPAVPAQPAAPVAPTAGRPARDERSGTEVPAAPRGLSTERAPLAEQRATAEFVAAPVLPVAADGSAQVATPAASGIAPLAGAEPARQDFAALVDRLVEIRNAGMAQSTHASVHHAEFGQVSLKFQQDGGDLSVSMSSADPDFAIAAQAAMPADRQNFNSNADAQPRNNQGQQQASAQANANSSNAQHEASAQRDAAGTDQQGRGNRGGRNSNADDSSNPSPRWSDRDQPQSRGGIFA